MEVEVNKTTNNEDEDNMTLARLCTRKSSIHLPMVVSDQPGTPSSYKRKQALLDDDKTMRCPKERAEEVRANLDPEFPSFVKTMLPSHISGGFWLGIPSQFCKSHLPKMDATMTLVNENQKEYPARYLPRKIGLSGGWRGFAIAHELVEGDALVFQLVEATKFQVYIIRAYSLGPIDGVIGLLTLDSDPKHASQSKSMEMSEETDGKRQKTVTFAACQPPTGEESGSDSDGVGSEILEGIRFSEDTVEFKDVKNLESFSIAVNGLIIDSEFSMNTRKKYYTLCCSQNDFLHNNLLEGINMKLAAGIISETVDIAYAIKASKLSNSRDDIATWDKSLGALELLGMNVGFLRAQLQRLLSIATESEEAVNSERYSEAIVERARVEEELRIVKAKLPELETALKRLDTEVETQAVKARRYELKFREEITSPW